MVQPQKTKKKQSIETKATDSTAVMRDHTTSSTIEEWRRFCGAQLGENTELPKLWGQIGVKYEERSLGQREIETGGEKLRSSHRKADDDHLDADISLTISLSLSLS